ncbi:MAG: hypothetical protein AAF985_20865, partial [Bacteroidota bacterium]
YFPLFSSSGFSMSQCLPPAVYSPNLLENQGIMAILVDSLPFVILNLLCKHDQNNTESKNVIFILAKPIKNIQQQEKS